MGGRSETVMLVLLKLHFILMLCPVQSSPCQSSCGNGVSVYFPFGIGEGCYMDKRFEVTCDNSSSPSKPILTSVNMELRNVYSSFISYQVQVFNPVVRSNCSRKPSNVTGVSLSNSPFIFSKASNRFTAMGCDNYAMLFGGVPSNLVGGCLSICPRGAHNSTTGCYGINCCQATIPPNMTSFEVNMANPFSESYDGCKAAFMVDQDWFDSQSSSTTLDDLSQMDQVPVVLDWAYDQGYCRISDLGNANARIDGIFHWEELNTSQVCICQCQDPNNCIDSSFNYNCQLYCLYRPGGECPCPYGFSNLTYSSSNRCYPDFLVTISRGKNKAVIIGCVSAFGFLFLLIGIWSLYKLIKRRQATKLRKKFFKRNGGLLLEQQLSSTDDHVEQTKLFTSSGLDKATDYYNVNRILGQGGQGTVYKGMLTDGRVVAIKKSKVVDEDKLDQFINEVVILSQINHRNVVKLIGCCLETEVPLLVYEFIPNGTLFQYIHNPSEEFALTWEMRLRIATEVAGALAYLHSAASIPIYHRDIKSSNILLDEKYRAKVADFGTSRSILIDQTHVTTRVQGTFGYLDPEYFQSSQFTEKSDVYSFGVVLVELLTGQKAISSLRSAEERSLATYFLSTIEEDRLFEILDARVLQEGSKEEIIGVAKLARRCLDLNGKRRPTMKTLTMLLEGIRSSQGASFTNEKHYEEADYSVGDYTGPLDVTSSSSRSINGDLPNHSDVQVQPLLCNASSRCNTALI